MENTYNLQKARIHVKRVFRFLQELHRVKTSPITDLGQHEWALPLENLPRTPSILWGASLENSKIGGMVPPPPGMALSSFLGFGKADRDFILKVGRPTETEGPSPSVVIEEWLGEGWDKPHMDPRFCIKKKIRNKSESFESSEERVNALEDWIKVRKPWAEAEKEVRSAINVFNQLFDVWGKMVRESEKYQLYLGDGILVMETSQGKVAHPLLLQRVQLDFDAKVPQFILSDTVDPSELYSSLLRFVGLEGRAILNIEKTLKESNEHPMGGEETSAFFKDLVQRFWSAGVFFETKPSIEPPEVMLYRRPTLYLGNRNQGFADNLQRYLEAIPDLESFPKSLLRVVGIEERQTLPQKGEVTKPLDLLFTKHANSEQEMVVRRLEESGAVLVQGPPGTGKSHTIANLIGHLLAQKKSILVTSHASKALRVVREKVAEPLQALCVSVLDNDVESYKQLEESIEGIINSISRTNEKKLKAEIASLGEKRTTMKREQKGLREKISTVVEAEYKAVELLGKQENLTQLARWLNEASSEHGWIEGSILVETGLPLSDQEIKILKASCETLHTSDEQMLSAALPDIEKLPTPQEFAETHDQLSRLDARDANLGKEYWSHDKQESKDLEALLRRAEEAIKPLDVEKKWTLECIEAGRKGQKFTMPWFDLIGLIEECNKQIPELESDILEHGPKISGELSPDNILKICNAIMARLLKNKTVGKLTMIFRPEWKTFMQNCSVDGVSPSTYKHFRALASLIKVERLRSSLVARWDRQMTPLGAPSSEKLGSKPERTALEFVEGLRFSLSWHSEFWDPIAAKIEDVGFKWKRFVERAPAPEKDFGQILRLKAVVTNDLKGVFDARLTFLSKSDLEVRQKPWIEAVENFKKIDSSYPIVKLLRQGLRNGNFEDYQAGFDQLKSLLGKKGIFKDRNQIIEKIRASAPKLAENLESREKIPLEKLTPENFHLAWRFAIAKQKLESLASDDLEDLQEKLEKVSVGLHEINAAYVEKLAWLAQLHRTGLKQQQALSGWLGLNEKIGKGSGKNVGRLKEAARQNLVECRSAVPVWIMPLSRVFESFDLATTTFDVLIIDEASQSDVMGLTAFALAKEVVVVGDHEQVTPYAIGQQIEKVQGLIDELLVDIPNKQLYDARTSIYDLARQSFGGTIRLVEHFRCVPDIIQFSNQLCYGGEIRPLREASSSQIKPALVSHRVKDGQSHNKVNQNEALEIASIIIALCRLEPYENCTIGVISMVGTDQALYIDSILRQRMPASDYKKRRILCGNAAQFQGDERDIIFLSMVDSPKDKPLFLRTRDDAKKLFNVAASRARDQLWVVHSLSAARDLKHGDLRLKLLQHAEDPSGLRPKETKKTDQFNSHFEKIIFQKLTESAYHVIPRYAVGEHKIDLVVEGSKGKRAAIQCDGDREMDTEAIQISLSHQIMLERLGWTFLRLRASEFCSKPDEAYKKLLRRLGRLEINQWKGYQNGISSGADDESSLYEDLVKKAEAIRIRWKNIPNPEDLGLGLQEEDQSS